MQTVDEKPIQLVKKGIFQKRLMTNIIRHRYIYLLMIPGVIYMLVFRFAPMWGLVLAFKNFNPYIGMRDSPWVGFAHFTSLFSSQYFFIMLRNTLLINILQLVFYFPLPIILSILINEVRHDKFKRINQSIVYMPHFLSWVVVVSLTYFLLSYDFGMINKILRDSGADRYSFLTNARLFWGIITVQIAWREMGWGTIIFLASLAGIDPQQYEAAVIDGAGRWKQIWYITLPGIRPVIIILTILRLGQIADVGLEQILLMQNPLVMSHAEVFDTYAFTQGILRGQLSIGVTVGLFKSLIGLLLVVSANKIVKRLGHSAIY